MIRDFYPLLIFALLQLILTGFFFRHCVLRLDLNNLGISIFFLDFAIGTGVLTYWLLFGYFIFGKIFFVSYYIFVILSLIYAIKNWTIFRDFWITKRIRFPVLENIDFLSLIFWLLILRVIFSVILRADYGPLEWDAWDIYGLHAKAYYYDRIIPKEFMFDLGPYVFSVINYRYLVPMTEAWILFHLGGNWDNTFAYLTVIYYIGFLLFLFAILRQQLPRLVALLIILLVSILHQAIHLGSTGMTDLILAFYFLTGIYFLYQWMNDMRGRNLLLSAFLFLCSALTKKEGTSMILLVTIIIFLYLILQKSDLRKKMFPQSLSYLLTLIIGYIPWIFIFLKSLSLSSRDIPVRIYNPAILWERVIMIFSAFYKQWTNWTDWGLLWLIIVVGLIFAVINFPKTKNKSIYYLWMIYLGQFMIYFLIYLTHRGHLPYFLETSPFRLLFHLAPGLVFLSIFSMQYRKNSK